MATFSSYRHFLSYISGVLVVDSGSVLETLLSLSAAVPVAETTSASEGFVVSLGVAEASTGADDTGPFGRGVTDAGLADDDDINVDVPLVTTTVPSSVADATRAPANGIIIVEPTSQTYAVIYQTGSAGANGLVFSRSLDFGATWESEVQISSRENVYGSAVVNPTTGDVHLLYSRHGDATLTTGWDIYYRVLIWDEDTFNWTVGSEQIIEQSSTSSAFSNVSLSVDNNGFLWGAYLHVRDEQRPAVRTIVGNQQWTLGISTQADQFDLPYNAEIRPLATFCSGPDYYCLLLEQLGTYHIAISTTTLSLVGHTFSFSVQQAFQGLDTHQFDATWNESPAGLDAGALLIAYIGEDNRLYRRFYTPTTDSLSDAIKINLNSVSSPTVTRSGNGWDLAYMRDLGSNNRRLNLQILSGDGETFSNFVLDSDSAGDKWEWTQLPRDLSRFDNVVIAWSDTLNTPYNIHFGVVNFGVLRDVIDTITGTDTILLAIAVADSATGAVTVTFYGEVKTVAETITGTDTIVFGPDVEETVEAEDSLVQRVVPSTSEAAVGEESYVVHLSVDDALQSFVESLIAEDEKTRPDTVSATDSVSIRLTTLELVSILEELSMSIPVPEAIQGDDSSQIEIPLSVSASALEAILYGPQVNDSVTAVDSPMLEISVQQAISAVEVGIPVIAVAESAEGEETVIPILMVSDSSSMSEFLQGTRERAVSIRLFLPSGGATLRLEGPLGGAVISNPQEEN